MTDKAYALMDRTTLTGGVAADTFGTAVNFTIPTWCKGLLALYVLAVHPTVTAAEGQSGILRLISRSLGISGAKFGVGPVMTSSPATNEEGYSAIADVILLDIKTNGGEVISLDAAPAGASTAGVKYEVGFLMSNNPRGLPKDFIDRLPQCEPFRDGDVVDAQQLTTTRTALTAIKTPTWAEAIVGYRGVVTKTGAITAAEEGYGYFDIQNSMGLTPLIVPATFGSSATLGTPVGQGPHAARLPYLPIYVPLSGKEETFTPYIVLDAAVTTDNRVALALAWR